MSRRSKTTLANGQIAAVWQSASLLLGYPDERLVADLPVVRQLAAAAPVPIAERLVGLVDHLSSTTLDSLQESYVETFDNRRRCSLFLTYFSYGDTRKRGAALLGFKQTYLRAGLDLDGSELPDHLCVVLEFGATVDLDLGWRLVLDHRAGLEVLRLALRDSDSPWGAAVDAVCATLPPLPGDERHAIRRLASEGPPVEEVGLAPYGGVTVPDTAVAAPAFVGMPAVRGRAR